MLIEIQPSHYQGELRVPGSKSQTLRALFFGAFAKSESIIINPLLADDSMAMIDCLKNLKAKFIFQKDSIRITPIDLNTIGETRILDVKNSGITFRFMTAISALLPGVSLIVGDESIRKQRPIKPLTQALTKMGAKVEFLTPDSTPLRIEGPIVGQNISIQSVDSQPITALLYLAALSQESHEINFSDCEEKPWLDLSFSWLNFLKIPAAKIENQFLIKSHLGFDGFCYHVPGDFSSAAFFIALALIHRSPIKLFNIDISDLQPDKVMIDLIMHVGCKIEINPIEKSLLIDQKEVLDGFEFDLELGIDLLPILSVLGCFLKSPTRLFNGKIARLKESDRISSIAKELKKMGGNIVEFEDGLIIYPSELNGAQMDSHSDHRIAMSLSIAATKANGPSKINGIECINKTFPDFFKILKTLKQ